MGHTILRGGRVLDIAAGTADYGDILIEDDTIREIGPPGSAAPDGASEISAARRLLHPGLINAHTHGNGNLAKGMGDCWTLELLLAAAPWITGNRRTEDKYLSTQLGAVEMVLKGWRRLRKPMPMSACARSWRRWSPTAAFTRLFPDCWTHCRRRSRRASRSCACRPPKSHSRRSMRHCAAVRPTARGYARRWRRRSRTTARMLSYQAARNSPASSMSDCTAMSASRRSRP